MTKKLFITVLTVLVAGCSSPPEPLPLEWDKPAQQVNTRLPRWEPDNTVIASPVVTGHWSYIISNFDKNYNYPVYIWFMVAHSSHFVISASDAQSYFETKEWLRTNGAKGIITFQKNTDCLTCQSIRIYLSR
ncbi:hypothetical protein AB295_22215 [Salmonella enterica]|uniref:Cag pathogenicity island protein Cag12 n=1 Tax=Salmonella enterica subsp. enterica serovar Rubislaw str. ATCC 10717 TaxID=938143 RepID=A0A6W0P1R1_SALRU|nr:hypothetical protein [Salmonella enterica]EBY1810921.1 hypothetical protein [Salmonella enterica subsp. enterica serovar Rubislaw]HAA1128121.1 hypothetical protein [Salmonella enterica subsp. enterica serovar Rubislaw str. ATCC 10717]EAY7317695.1 hypothetical protein [Salmonella enterica]EBA2968977.1 hypothetical protein [Salmonella enterica]